MKEWFPARKKNSQAAAVKEDIYHVFPFLCVELFCITCCIVAVHTLKVAPVCKLQVCHLKGWIQNTGTIYKRMFMRSITVF